MWEVSGTNEFGDWYESLKTAEQEAIDARIELLVNRGPDLKRPVVGEISSSKLQSMKELRASVGVAKLRVLFIFDPRREAVLLLGGDKSENGLWNDWYLYAIPKAEALYVEYLLETGQTSEEK
jgi:hypothetical protein